MEGGLILYQDQIRIATNSNEYINKYLKCYITYDTVSTLEPWPTLAILIRYGQGLTEGSYRGA